MNTLLNFYFKLPQDQALGIFTKATNRIIAKFLKIILDKKVPSYFKKSQSQHPFGLNQENRNQKVIVSLTSFPERIGDVWIVVECLFRQSFKADKIILWLDKDRFNFEALPLNLKAQLDRGLEIKYVEDFRSHTKYFYALNEFRDSCVITVDDDCYYPTSLIQNLIDINNKYPNSIASNRIHKLKFDGDKIVAYKKWQHNYNPNHEVNGKYLLTGVSGVLYPPNIFDESIFDNAKFMQICKFADDVWLSFHAFRLKIDIASNDKFNKDMISISKSSQFRLLDFNSKENGNDGQIKAVLDEYKMVPSFTTLFI